MGNEVVLADRKHLVYMVILLVVVLLNIPLPASFRIKSSAQNGVTPFQNVMSLIISRIEDMWGNLRNAGKVIGEKREMEALIAELRLKVRDLKENGRENDELKELLGFKKKAGYKLLLSEVVARGDASGWWQTITINKGSGDGVAPDMAVITVDGLVGHTSGVLSRHSCQIKLITDTTSRVACKMSRTGTLGIIKGKGVAATGNTELNMLASVNPCRAEYLNKEADIKEGDEVVSSGLGGVFPGGLVVGRVTKCETDPSGLYKNAEVMPCSDMNSLKYVFVVLK